MKNLQSVLLPLETIVELLYRLDVDPHKVRVLADMSDIEGLDLVARELREKYNNNGFYASY